MDNVENLKNTNDKIDELLKSHYLKRDNIDIVSIGNRINNLEKRTRKKENTKEEEKDTSDYLFRFKYRLGLKTLGALLIVLSVYAYKSFPDEIKNSKIINWIKAEYSKSYSKVDIIENVEELSKKIYDKAQSIIPEEMYTSVTNKYIYDIKPKLLNFSLNKFSSFNNIENTVTVFNENDIPNNIDHDMVIAEEAVTTSSELSLMSMDVKEILDKNINIIAPVSGTVTSIYGAREEVFKNVGYHTGVDIANSYDTPIKSATSGVVVLVQSMDKYYGNNIEIETDGVIFKYAHLNKINVSVGDEIKQGQIIGLMGSTGASTGSHLHFEIMINGRSVDPELIISVR